MHVSGKLGGIGLERVYRLPICIYTCKIIFMGSL